MKQIDPQQWSAVSQALDALLGRPQEDHESVIASLGLDQACEALVRQMLAADAATNSVVDQPARQYLDNASPLDEIVGGIPAELVGERFGAYEVVDEIGRGGMGAVLRARRADGEFDKQVALKLIRPGTYTDAMKERFRLEMRTLATLEHPHIAHLIDGGISEEGIPYFVMELVDGAPITTFCDAAALGVKQRLELFRQVCQAVAHAHSRLIVHGDLKPSNILVSAKGQVKLVDFGISRNLAEDAFVELPRVTPQYAAPEQFSSPIADTKADVFGLTGTLYHLLCGSPPRKTELSEITLASVRMAGDANSAEQIARDRSATAHDLRKTLSGELDCLLEKGLRLQPSKRLSSAEMLNQEIDRFLARLPLQCMPDSTGYRLRKYIQRHRVGVVVGALTGLAVCSISLVAVWQANEARVQAHREATVRAFLEDTFNSVSPLVTQGDEVSARQIIDNGTARLSRAEVTLPAVTVAELHHLFGDMYYDLGEYEQAVVEFGKANSSDALPSVLRAQINFGLGRSHKKLGNYDEAIGFLDESVALAPMDSMDSVAFLARGDLGYVLNRLGELDQSEELLRDSLARLEAFIAQDPEHPAAQELLGKTKHNLSITLGDTAQWEESIVLAKQAMLHLTTHWGTDYHPSIALILNTLGSNYRNTGQLELGHQMVTKSLAINVAINGEDHPSTLIQRMNFASNLTDDAPEQAIAEAQRVINALAQPDQPAYPWECVVLHAKGRGLENLRRFDEAVPVLRQASELAIERLGESNYRAGLYRVALGRALWKSGDWNAAERVIQQGVTGLTEAMGADHPRTLTAAADQIVFLAVTGRTNLRDELWPRLMAAAIETNGSDSELVDILVAFGDVADSPELTDALQRLSQNPPLTVRGHDYELAREFRASLK